MLSGRAAHRGFEKRVDALVALRVKSGNAQSQSLPTTARPGFYA
jgi:hypothetical protein